MQQKAEGLLAVHLAVLIFGHTALFSKLIALPTAMHESYSAGRVPQHE